MLPPDSILAFASACGFTEVALPMASWLCEAVDCSSVNNPTSRSAEVVLRESPTTAECSESLAERRAAREVPTRESQAQGVQGGVP